MATGQDDEFEPSKIIGAISRLAGTLVGTAVLTGRRVIISVTPVGGSSSDKLEDKSARAPAKRKKKATHKKKNSKTERSKPAPEGRDIQEIEWA